MLNNVIIVGDIEVLMRLWNYTRYCDTGGGGGVMKKTRGRDKARWAVSRGRCDLSVPV